MVRSMNLTYGDSIAVQRTNRPAYNKISQLKATSGLNSG
jgi:hypothetical protein